MKLNRRFAIITQFLFYKELHPDSRPEASEADFSAPTAELRRVRRPAPPRVVPRAVELHGAVQAGQPPLGEHEAGALAAAEYVGHHALPRRARVTVVVCAHVATVSGDCTVTIPRDFKTCLLTGSHGTV